MILGLPFSSRPVERDGLLIFLRFSVLVYTVRDRHHYISKLVFSKVGSARAATNCNQLVFNKIRIEH